MKREVNNNNKEQVDNKKAKQEHPFFDMASKKTIKWVTSFEPMLILGSTKGSNEIGKSKIAAFDLDGTLICTKSGYTYARDGNDWRWWNSNIPKRIEELHQEGFKIVIFSNQNGLRSIKQINIFKYKMENILTQINVPAIFFGALQKDLYRKPMLGMWDLFTSEYNQQITIDKSKSFFVGDAAGRAQNWKPKYKKDHSSADRKFAHNIGIGFTTPEEFFLKEEKAAFEWGGFHAASYLEKALPAYEHPLVLSEQELIICVGYPASGKSSFVKNNLVAPHNYVYINQDTLKTKEKCVKACAKALEEKSSVVIDNTNPESATRALYIKLAQKHNIPVRCFYFGDNEAMAIHNNYYRALYKSDPKREPLSSIAYNVFKSKFQAPDEKEGFKEVKRIHFVFESSEEDKQAWLRWWL